MDQQREPTFEESIKEVMETLPPPIRNYLSQGKYSIVAKNLMRKYGLHIDQGGVLEREIMLLLMGIESPDEFAAALKSEAAIAEDVVRNIMTDVNREIFIPLREEMRNTDRNADNEARGAGMSSPAHEEPIASAPQADMPALRPAPLPPPPPAFFAAAPLPPKMTMPPSVPSTVPASVQPNVLAEEARARISNITPRSEMPLPSVPTGLPGAMPPRAAPEAGPGSAAPAPITSYSVDPYREPVDEPPQA